MSDDLDEVLIRGTRLRELRAAIVVAENRFYQRYNDLNKVDDFDIECAQDIHTGQRVPQRRCFTKLQKKAMAQQGKEVVEMFQRQAAILPDGPGQSGSGPGPAGMTGAGRPPNTDPLVVWLSRYDEYRENMLYLLKAHPELRRMAQDAEKAKQRYDDEYRRRMKGRLFLRE